MKLTTYLNKIEAKYITAREEWEKLQKELKAEDDRYQGIKWQNYTYEGQKEEQERHNRRVSEIKGKLSNLRTKFSDSVDGIVSDSDKVFNKVYQYTPSDVDMNGVAILQNSTMRDSELMTLAESYKKAGNYTMYFMVADKIKGNTQEGKNYKVLAASARDSRDDRECLRTFGEVCMKALRDNSVLANGTHGLHDDYYQKCRKTAEGIEANTPVPWE